MTWNAEEIGAAATRRLGDKSPIVSAAALVTLGLLEVAKAFGGGGSARPQCPQVYSQGGDGSSCEGTRCELGEGHDGPCRHGALRWQVAR